MVPTDSYVDSGMLELRGVKKFGVAISCVGKEYMLVVVVVVVQLLLLLLKKILSNLFGRGFVSCLHSGDEVR